nr:tyrosinase ustq [Quercus suber]
MWPFRSSIKYQAVAVDEEKCEAKEIYADAHALQDQTKANPRRPSYPVLIGTIIVLVLLSVGVFLARPPKLPYYDAFIPGTEDATLASRPRCAKRQEWRTLSATQQQAYLTAVLCLRDQPSALAPASDRTSYDDFPWMHSHVGRATRHASPYLPWHRYFLHVYETALRDKCGYTGGLVYWDWTRDAAALEKSPVLDAKTGFGAFAAADGDVTAGRWGFRGSAGHSDGHEVQPESIEEVLRQPEYEQFETLMESRVNDAIPFGIAGDSETSTAAYDPLFFLHHTQLDRLWWMWQQRQPDRGLRAYNGRKQRHSTETASIDDTIHMKGLAADVRVADVMDVEGDMLCYTY